MKKPQFPAQMDRQNTKAAQAHLSPLLANLAWGGLALAPKKFSRGGTLLGTGVLLALGVAVVIQSQHSEAHAWGKAKPKATPAAVSQPTAPQQPATPTSVTPPPATGTIGTPLTPTAPATDTPTAATALPAGAEEYNKGCELFTIAKQQGQGGNTNGEKQLLRESLKHFETALTQNPKLVEAQSNIGFVYLTQQNYSRAIASFIKALTLNAQHLNTLNGLATAYAFDNNIPQAIITFDKLTRLAPGNSEFYFNKGSVLQKAGKLADASTAYSAALKIDPRNQFALFNMGTLLENQGKLAEAKTYYEQAKSVEVGNTAGLEAIQRLNEINASLRKK